MRKRILFSTIIAICSVTFSLLGSSYLAFRGSWKGKGFTFKAHHANIYNYRRNKKTGKVRHYRWTRSSFRLLADKNFLISKKSHIIFRKKKTHFKGYARGKKGYYPFSDSLGARGHVTTVRLVVHLFNKKTGAKFTVNKKFRLQRNYASRLKLDISEIK